jgi:hypothetical protein
MILPVKPEQDGPMSKSEAIRFSMMRKVYENPRITKRELAALSLELDSEVPLHLPRIAC